MDDTARWDSPRKRGYPFHGFLSDYPPPRRIDLGFEVGVEKFAAEVGPPHAAPDKDDGRSDEDGRIGSHHNTDHDGE